jgi:hypothetical protein
MLARKALRQDEVNEEGICDGESRGKIERRAVGNATHETANERTESKPETERGANHTHGARALFRSGDVGDIGLGNGDVPAGDAGKNSCHEKQRQRGRHSHKGEADRRARDAHEQDGTAAEAVGEFSQNRREDNLHAGINAGEPANRDWRGLKMLRVKGQDGDDDTEADHVDEDGKEEDK